MYDIFIGNLPSPPVAKTFIPARWESTIVPETVVPPWIFLPPAPLKKLEKFGCGDREDIIYQSTDIAKVSARNLQCGFGLGRSCQLYKFFG